MPGARPRHVRKTLRAHLVRLVYVWHPPLFVAKSRCAFHARLDSKRIYTCLKIFKKLGVSRAYVLYVSNTFHARYTYVEYALNTFGARFRNVSVRNMCVPIL